jgi:hypothetical protein
MDNDFPGVDVAITLFCDFRQFSAEKNWRFSQKPMLGSNFCKKWQQYEQKTPMFSLNFSAKIFKKSQRRRSLVSNKKEGFEKSPAELIKCLYFFPEQVGDFSLSKLNSNAVETLLSKLKFQP